MYHTWIAMSKRELIVTDPAEILKILQNGHYLSLALCDKNMPYVLPMNYGFALEDGQLTLYLHGALTGYKYELIRKNPNVSFSIVTDIIPFEGKKPCQYGTSYSSILGTGTIEMIESVEDKIAAMELFMSSQTGKDFEFNEALVSIVNLMKINVSEFSAKHRPLPAVFTAEQ